MEGETWRRQEEKRLKEVKCEGVKMGGETGRDEEEVRGEEKRR